MEESKQKMKFIDNPKIHEERNKVIVEYTEGRSGRIRSDFQREQAVAKEYRGRELIELLQNTEDAAYEDERTRGKGKVLITLRDNSLIIENTGKPFDFEGIHSIMLADDSPKDPLLKDVIGNKGLGFRSILSWAETIKISSSKVCVEFSQNGVSKLEQDILSKKASLAEELINTPISVLSAPIILDDSEHNSEYDTRIEIKCKSGFKNEQGLTVSQIIKNQINEMVQEDVLVFLRNTKELVLDIENEETKHYSKEIKISTEIDGGIKKEKVIISLLGDANSWKYSLYTSKKNIKVFDEKKGKEVDKKVLLGLAIPSTHKIENNFLYSFFRTKIVNPFSFLLNATLELSQNRNYLITQDDSNTQTIEHLIPFIFSALEEYTLDQVDDHFALLKLLAISDFKHFLEEYQFSHKFIEILKTKQILPNVNGSFLSVINNGENLIKTPILSMDFAQNVKGILFDDLIEFSLDEQIINFIKYLGIKSYKDYSVEDFVNRINKYISRLKFTNENERIEYFSLLLKLFYNEFGNTQTYPTLFINSKHEAMNSTKKLYIIDNNMNNQMQIPDWLDFDFALKEQVVILCNLFKMDIVKLIETFDGIPYKSLNYRQIFEAINTKFNEELSIAEIVNIHNWLFAQYKSHTLEFQTNSNILRSKVICGRKEKQSISIASEVYFPDHYDNGFMHNLLKNSKCKFLVGKSVYRLDGNDNEIIEYFKLLGVNKYPREIQVVLDSNTFSMFFKSIKGFDNVHSYLQAKHSSGSITQVQTTYTISSVEYIEHILRQSFPQIISFLHLLENERKSVFDKLTDKTKGNKDEIRLHYIYSRSPYWQDENIGCNYLWWLMSNIKWVDYKIEKTVSRTSPNLCSFDNIDVHGFLERPYWSIKEIQKEHREITDLKIKTILEKLGATNDLGDLSIDRMYDLMNALPKIDTECIVARRVYDKIFDSIKTDQLEYNKSNRSFITQGKVSAIRNKVKQYYPVSEVNYSDNKTLSDEILDDIVFFDLPYRKGAKKVGTIFGVSKLNSDKIKICDEQIKYHYLDGDFQKSIKHLKPYIVVKRKAVFSKGKDDDLLRNSNVYLVDGITVEYQLSSTETKKYKLSEYSFVWISKERKGYIVIPATIFETSEHLFRNTQFADALAELICLILTVYDGKESYRELIKDIDNREYLLEKDLGPNAITMLNEVRTEYGIIASKKDAFYTILKTISNHKFESAIRNLEIFDEREFDFENLNSQNNLRQIVKLFKYLKVNIDSFNLNSESYKIHIEDYHKEQFQKLVIDLKDRYKTHVFTSAMAKSENERLKYLLDEMKQYLFYNHIFPNSVLVNYDVEYEKKTKIKPQDLPNTVDFSEIISNNLELYSAKDEIKFNEIIKKNRSDYENYALLDILDIYYDSSIRDSVTSTQKNKTETVEINFNDLKNNVDQTSISPNINIANIEKTKYTEHNQSTTVRQSTNNFGLSNEALKQENGFIAEYYAYRKLTTFYGEENINWVSKNSSHAFPDKSYNDNLHYDISYVDKGKEHYVEVKKISVDDLSFDISKAEVEFGESNTDTYHIYCVAVENKRPIDDKSVLVKKFFSYAKSEGFTHNNKFTVVTNSFRIKTKIVQK